MLPHLLIESEKKMRQLRQLCAAGVLILAVSVPSHAGVVWGDKSSGLATGDGVSRAEATFDREVCVDLTSLLQDLWRATVHRFGALLSD